MSVSRGSLLSLDPDVLLLIFERAQAARSLGSLSRTCSWVRELSSPILFARIRLLPQHFTPHSFLPRNLWPHVRTLEFNRNCHFEDPEVVEQCKRRARRWARHATTERNHKFLFDALHGMPQLCSLAVDTPSGGGLPFWILDALLSAPQLSSVQFGPTMCLRSDEDPTIPDCILLTGPVAPIISFRRVLPSFASYSTAAAEADTLSCLFEQIHQTLQVAEMPIETAPLRTFQTHDWPCLRELVLRGEPQASASSSFADVLARMPNLRILKLELAQLVGTGPIRVSPSGWKSAFPCSNLEELTVSFPDPDDNLYTCLPVSLQKLTLRCFPRHYIALAPKTHGRFMPERGWTSSLLPSSEMLRLLRRCGSSLGELRHLDIEFEESEDDILLLRYIAVACPMLTSLQFLRYHKEPGGDVSFVADFGVALASLTHLRLLRVHLDLARSDIEGLGADVIGPLVRPLSATVRFACVLWRKYCASEWAPYRIIRDSSTGEVTGLECVADSYVQIDGFCLSDEIYLPTRRRHGRVANRGRPYRQVPTFL